MHHTAKLRISVRILTDDVWSLRTHRAVTPYSVNSGPFDLHVGLDMAIGCNTTQHLHLLHKAEKLSVICLQVLES